MATEVEKSTESRAICRYLATKYPHRGNSLLPDLSKIRTVTSVELNNFDALAGSL
jgi:glutathione S-transferase